MGASHVTYSWILGDATISPTAKNRIPTKTSHAAEMWANPRMTKPIAATNSPKLKAGSAQGVVAYVFGSTCTILDINAECGSKGKTGIASDMIGAGKETTVTFSLGEVTLRSALRLMLRELELTYVVRDEVLKITTLDEAVKKSGFSYIRSSDNCNYR